MLNLFYFIIGFVVGCFLNMCIVRLPNRQATVIPDSRGKRYPLVELLTGLLFVLCFTREGFSVYLFRELVLTCFLIVITYIDYDYHIILDKVLIWFAGAALVINIYIGDIGLLEMLLAGLFGGSVFLLLALISKGGFGGGDVKFMAALGIWLGLKYTVLVLLLSFLLGGLGSGVLLALGLKGRKDYIPYGPFMALAAFLAILYGKIILEWYLG